MTMWPDRRLLDLLGIENPIIQAPMAAAMDTELVIAACAGGALGSLPCAMLSVDEARKQIAVLFSSARAPFNVNFFCHAPLASDEERDARWKKRLSPYYEELGLDPNETTTSASRARRSPTRPARSSRRRSRPS